MVGVAGCSRACARALHSRPPLRLRRGRRCCCSGASGFGYFSRGEARRAESLESARESSAALNRARTAAATSNVMYGVAGLTLAYGLLLEFLPEPAADAASLTYHF